jgi:hypothetical protein
MKGFDRTKSGPDQFGRGARCVHGEVNMGPARGTVASVSPRASREEMFMPEKRTVEKALRAKRAGKAPTTQAGEFVREEVRKIRRGEHGARSPQQVIAIGLSEARRAGVALSPPSQGRAKESTRRSAKYAYKAVKTKGAAARSAAARKAARTRARRKG